MCGIFGLIVKPNSNIPPGAIKSSLKALALLSESRGKDSSGIAFRNGKTTSIVIIKGDVPIRSLLKNPLVNNQFSNSFEAYKDGFGFTTFGHARLVTNGSQLLDVNNQPVIKDNIVLIHNGIIVNVDELWKSNTSLTREYQIDTEIINSLLREEIDKQSDLIKSCRKALGKLEGTFSVATMFADLNQFVLASNNGSLYFITDNESFIFFASERYYLQQLKTKNHFKHFHTLDDIKQVTSDTGIVIDMQSLQLTKFSLLDPNQQLALNRIPEPYELKKQSISNEKRKKEVVIDPLVYIDRNKDHKLFKLLENNTEAISKLRRCTKCVLPETFPFIEFDSKGVCNYCNNYKPKEYEKSFDNLKSLVEPYKRKDGRPDCIVPFSGGRDSTYSLHIIKRELGLNPIAFTYDWGMVTDLARRNIARVCGRLGVENIIVSADIRWKRENIKKNISAWLKNPSLGMIPLFMAGDKYFFYYTNRLKKQTGINLNIWGINHLENTEFKTGFAGLRPNFEKERIYSLSLFNQLKLFGYVAKNVLLSPSYINQSVLDSLGSFAVRYIAPKRDYYHLFDYYRWDEEEINSLLQNEYKWEKAIDTSTTWRIGDGTASFYNYIYYTVAGFSEYDTFRSNQIREGMLTREQAMKLVEAENAPRFEMLRWYLEIVGLDFSSTIRRINDIQHLYDK